MLKPDIKLFKLILKLLKSDERRWLYQKQAVRFFFNNKKIILHMARQTGKTYLASILVACYVICGKTVVIAFPTLKQGKRLLLGESLKRLLELQKIHPFCSMLKFKVNNQEEILCVNGGRVIVLTTNSEAKSREGYSASLIVIDEAHQAHKDVFDEIFPITFAQEENEVKTLLLGIGGYRNSLIADMKKRGCAVLKLDGEYIASVYEPYVDKIKEAKESLSPEGFAAQIMCEDIVSGEKYIFNTLFPDLEINRGRGIPYAGIDVGWVGDETVVTIMKVYAGEICVVEDYMTIKGNDWDYQASEIIQYLRKHNVPEPYTMIEQNNVGYALILAMQKFSSNYNWLFLGKNKEHLIQYARLKAIQHELYIQPNKYRDELEGLVMKTLDNGSLDYDHSDILSSLLMALANLCYA